MLARVVAAQGHVVNLADVHEFLAAGVADGALNVLFHLDQCGGQFALDWLQNAFAFYVFCIVAFPYSVPIGND